jgi:osmotically inducible lipoprotein OsmB
MLKTFTIMACLAATLTLGACGTRKGDAALTDGAVGAAGGALIGAAAGNPLAGAAVGGAAGATVGAATH